MIDLSTELQVCIAKIKSWDVFPDQEKSRSEVVTILEEGIKEIEFFCEELRQRNEEESNG